MIFAAKSRNPAAAAPKRREPRMAAALAVHVVGIDSGGNRFHQVASTMNISLSGARITGLAAKVNQGDTVILQTGEARIRTLFKVCWVTGQQDGTHHMGVYCLENQRCPWRDWLLARLAKKAESSGRIACKGTALLHPAGFAHPIMGTLRNIDEDGCFVRCVTESPLAGTMRGRFIIDGLQLDAVVAVRDSRPTIGVGLQWCDLGGSGLDKLRGIVRELMQRQILEHSSRLTVADSTGS